MSTRRREAPPKNSRTNRARRTALPEAILAALLIALIPGAAFAGAGQFPDWFDHAVPPRLDFFRYANGGWLKANPIPPDRSYWGVDTVLEQENQSFIREMLESLLHGEPLPDGSAKRKLGDFYFSGMDERAVDAAGIGPLQPELARIAAMGGSDDLRAEFAHLQLIGVSAPLQLTQMQDFKDSARVIAAAGAIPHQRHAGQ